MKRGAPLRRNTPLKRTRMKRRRSRRETRPGPGRDEAYLAWVRTLPCLFSGVSACWLGQVHAHHAGRKDADRTAVPLCLIHHTHWHDANGVFLGLGREQRREWAAKAIAETQARHGADHSRTSRAEMPS